MKYYTMYVCETCGYESKNVDDMEAHEASHLSLTVDELHEYNKLKSIARDMGATVSYANNEETRRQFDKSIEDLIAFEEKHGIAG